QHRSAAQARQVRQARRRMSAVPQSFRAYRIHQEGGKIAARLETIGLNDLAAGEIVVKVRYSTINYKDALAATGAGKILRKYPLVGGIDLARSEERRVGKEWRS